MPGYLLEKGSHRLQAAVECLVGRIFDFVTYFGLLRFPGSQRELPMALSCVGRLPVVFDGCSTDDFYSGIEVALCTVDESDVEAMSAKLHPLVNLDGRMHTGTLSSVKNGDGTATIAARFIVTGCRIIIR